MAVLMAQLRTELRVMARNGEQLLLIVIIPMALLLFFGNVDVLPTADQPAVDVLVPGIIALAVMSTAMVSLGIATGFERQYLVLKRLGATPLGRSRLVLAKSLAVVIIELVQLAAICVVGLAMGWSIESTTWLLLVGAAALGTFAFAGLGLILAGRLRAEVNLAAQNGLYLFLLLTGGMIIASSALPGPLESLSRALPAANLADALRQAVGEEGLYGSSAWVILAAWALVAPLAAARVFRWE
jgi:ABC-2 type transport system permease protein